VDATVTRAAAETLWKLWQDNDTIDALPEEQRPASLDEGWAIQRQVDELAGERIGWKIAASNPTGQAALGLDGPIGGSLYRVNRFISGATVAPGVMGVSEAEFSFIIGSALAPEDGPYSRERVIAAIGELRPAIEIPTSRFAAPGKVGAPSLLADCAVAGWCLVGEPVASWDPDELPSHAVTMYCNDEAVANGSGANVLGNPVDALVWLANDLASRGIGLAAGELVMTGSSCPPNPIKVGDRLRADFGSFGSAEAQLV
jgi:2-keto-4-pentenoate hydratase